MKIMKNNLANDLGDRLALFSHKNLTYSYKANIFIFAVYLVRTLYGLFIIDPYSGQDAPSYSEDAKIVLENGPFAQVSYAPIWPIGYTWFLSLIWKVGGLDSRLLGLTQSTLVLLATFALYQLVKREIGREIALISAILVSSSFAIFVSAGEIMYETPMMSLFLIGLNLISKFSLEESPTKKNTFFAGLAFALAIFIHPSMLGPVFISLLVVFFRIKKKGKSKIILLMLASLIVLTGPGMNTLRNYVSGDGLGYTANVYTISVFSGWGSEYKEKVAECNNIGVKITSPGLIDKDWYYDSTPRQLCLYRIALENPRDSLEVAISNAISWVSPYIGVLKSNGTWYHGLDIRRAVPEYHWWEGRDRVVDTILCSIWIVFHVTLMFYGAYLLFRRKINLINGDQLTPYLFVLPVAVKWVTSIFTHGDTRHRMAVSPLYITLIAIASYFIIQKLREKFVKS
jgi:hypothetical protein